LWICTSTLLASGSFSPSFTSWGMPSTFTTFQLRRRMTSPVSSGTTSDSKF
jgi:hypothetical protein